MEFIDGVPSYILHWEAYDRLYYEKDYEALIRLQKAYLKKNPDKPREQLMLADAYGYAGRHKSALKILKRLHRFDPFDSEYVEALVACLYKCDLNPRDFKWLREVNFFEKPLEVTDWCYAWLSKKGGHVGLCDVYMELWCAGYLAFDILGLEDVLSDDERFALTFCPSDKSLWVTINGDANKCSENA